MNHSKRFALTVSMLLVALPASSQAQLFDHLKCYKVKDQANFKADATLVALQAELGDESCAVKGKGKFFCGPVDKTAVENFEDKSKDGLGQVTLDGVGLSFDRICYKIKCASAGPSSLLVTDQFGTRTLEKFKAQLLCTPAVKGLPPTTTTTTTTTTLPICTADEKLCPDGTTVVRDPTNSCEFFPCPCVQYGIDCPVVLCPALTCSDGVTQYGCLGVCYQDPVTGECGGFTPETVCP